MEKENVEKEKACGCIIIEDQKVLLIKQKDNNWGFPKGHVEEGETEEETAAREVKEETNIDVEIESSKKYEMEYYLPNGNLKQVVLFIAKKIGGEEKRQQEEIAELNWYTFEEALEILTFNNTKEVLKKVMKELKGKKSKKSFNLWQVSTKKLDKIW